MNSAEVIRKISKKAGIPETENKKFFEIFLKQTSGILNPGESVKIPGVGTFQLRLGQLDNPAGTTEQQYIYSNLIVFMGVDDQSSDEGEIIFNVPDDIEKEYHSIDSYFSLSIGKPIIPLKGVKAAEFFIPPSGPELRGLFESKISRILEEAEKKTGGKETEIISLKPEKITVDIEPEEVELPVQSDFMKTREFENLSWDFGETLSQEIEEEKPEEIKEVSEQIEKVHVKREEAPNFEEEDFKPERSDEEIFEEVIDEETKWIENEPGAEIEELVVELESKTQDESEDIKNRSIDESENEPEEFIETVVEPELEKSEFEEMLLQEKESIIPPEIEDKGNEEIESEKPEKEELSLKNFQRVSSLTKEFNISVDEEKEEKTEEEKNPPKITEVRGGFQKVRRTTAEFNFDFSGMKGLDEEEVSEIREKSKSYKGYRKSMLPTFVIAGVVLLALAGIIYMYLNLKNENDRSGSSKPQTKVIERNYDVPATYPKDSLRETKSADIKNGEQLKNQNTITGELKPDQSEITEPVNSQRIENFIYQYPAGMVVQVSSWKSKSVAVGEVKKYRTAGYTAFAETSEIPGVGVYYRVRVGYFKTLDEARVFANGNQ
jgi:cell division septation protein DedD